MKMIDAVKSMIDLQVLATTDPRYAQLVLLAAVASGCAVNPERWKNTAAVMKGLRHLQTMVLETSAADVVNVVNSLRSSVTVTDTVHTKRGYSKAFTPADRKTQARYLLDQIPGALWRRVSDKCKRDGVSRRAVILSLLDSWSAQQ
jgi:hypothetical protein